MQSDPTAPWRISALYSDGGVILHNPSNIGGTYAWCHVEDDQIVDHGSSIILATLDMQITNNVAEYVAAVSALESVPNNWSGYLCSDSQVTLGRLFQGWKLDGIPSEWARRATDALFRLGDVRGILLQGHPNKADLLRGVGAKRNLPVSKWNVHCDRECQRQAGLCLERVRA
ncbi:MAG: hypothetical protein M1343_08245 [Chloroflexi bacterium]|nr:hypothetical protein [Chloroflexota bacterium]